MAYETHQTFQRFWQRLLREEIDGVQPEQRRREAPGPPRRRDRLMAFEDKVTLQSIWPGFTDEALQDLPPAMRERVARELESRVNGLVGAASGNAGGAFSDLLGLGPGGPPGFGAISWPEIEADFDDSIVPAQIQAVAELYFIYQHERMGVFRVMDMLRRLFHEGRMKVHRGPGARGHS